MCTRPARTGADRHGATQAAVKRTSEEGNCSTRHRGNRPHSPRLCSHRDVRAFRDRRNVPHGYWNGRSEDRRNLLTHSADLTHGSPRSDASGKISRRWCRARRDQIIPRHQSRGPTGPRHWQQGGSKHMMTPSTAHCARWHRLRRTIYQLHFATPIHSPTKRGRPSKRWSPQGKPATSALSKLSGPTGGPRSSAPRRLHTNPYRVGTPRSTCVPADRTEPVPLDAETGMAVIRQPASRGYFPGGGPANTGETTSRPKAGSPRKRSANRRL